MIQPQYLRICHIWIFVRNKLVEGNSAKEVDHDENEEEIRANSQKRRIMRLETERANKEMFLNISDDYGCGSYRLKIIF
jgi:hypothetical protein